MNPPRIFTLGVYGTDEESFFAALTKNGIETFCDIRARRGVRGSRYAFVNSKRLQARLSEMGIRYVHRKELSPTSEIRQAQWAEDETAGIKKRSRSHLGETFKQEYRRQILAQLDAASLLEDLGPVPVFFCVEAEAEACHRSLLTEAIRSQVPVDIVHLRP